MVWYCLGDGDSDMLEVSVNANVAILKKAIKAENPSMSQVDPGKIQLFLKEADKHDPSKALEVDATIGSVLEQGGGTNKASALYVHYDQPAAAAGSAALTDLQAKYDVLQGQFAVLSATVKNKRLRAFTSNPGHDAKSFGSRAPRIKEQYDWKCAFCGRQELGKVKLSIAHVANHDVDFSTTVDGRCFKQAFGQHNQRNGIALCTGGPDSCHSQFDCFNLALVPVALTNQWKVLCFAPDDWHATKGLKVEKSMQQSVGLGAGEDAHVPEVVEYTPSAHERFASSPPFRRVLAERLRKVLLEKQLLTPGLMMYCSTCADLSETKSNHGQLMSEGSQPSYTSTRASLMGQRTMQDEGSAPVVEGLKRARVVKRRCKQAQHNLKRRNKAHRNLTMLRKKTKKK